MSDGVVPLDPAGYRRAMRQLPGGVTVVTAADRNGPAGVTVSAIASVAAVPAVVSVALSRWNWVRSRAEGSGHFAVSLLGEHQRPEAERFSLADTSTFDGLELAGDAGQAPLLAGAPVGLRCRLVDVVELYERAVLFGVVEGARFGPHAEPLVYAGGTYLGVRDPSAPDAASG